MEKIPPKVKIFTEQSREKIEEYIDEFIQDIEEIDVMDIKFSCTDDWYNVMIIYR
jgi:hypothetical protein